MGTVGSLQCSTRQSPDLPLLWLTSQAQGGKDLRRTPCPTKTVLLRGVNVPALSKCLPHSFRSFGVDVRRPIWKAASRLGASCKVGASRWMLHEGVAPARSWLAVLGNSYDHAYWPVPLLDRCLAVGDPGSDPGVGLALHQVWCYGAKKCPDWARWRTCDIQSGIGEGVCLVPKSVLFVLSNIVVFPSTGLTVTVRPRSAHHLRHRAARECPPPGDG